LKGGENVKVETKIIEILNTQPESKDDDNLLFAEYLVNHYQDEFRPEDLSFLCGSIIQHRLATVFSTLRRQRQKVQETFPNLRGSKWNERHQMAEEFKGHFAKEG
jgi:hypothetical protein